MNDIAHPFHHDDATTVLLISDAALPPRLPVIVDGCAFSHFSSPAKVLVALARAGDSRLFFRSSGQNREIDELITAVRRYYSQVVILNWNDERGEAEPLSGDAEKKPKPVGGPIHRETHDHVSAAIDAMTIRSASQSVSQPDSHGDRSIEDVSSRSLVTEEELAMLTQPLDLDSIIGDDPPGEQASDRISGQATEQATGEEGRGSP